MESNLLRIDGETNTFKGENKVEMNTNKRGCCSVGSVFLAMYTVVMPSEYIIQR